jgi:two-component sensor histidine kinase
MALSPGVDMTRGEFGRKLPYLVISSLGVNDMREGISGVSEALEPLRRVQHEFKNNLQTVCSLLRIFSLDVHDCDARRVLKRMEGCVYSMATMYESVDMTATEGAIVTIGAYLHSVLSTCLSISGLSNLTIGGNAVSHPYAVRSRTACQIGLLFNETVYQCLVARSETVMEGGLRIDVLLSEASLNVVVAFANVNFKRERDASQAGARILQALLSQVDASVRWPWMEGSESSLCLTISRAYIDK